MFKMLQHLTAFLVAATAVQAAKTIDICASSGLGLDVFGIADDQSIFHKYYRGSQWEPTPGFESMNGIVPTYAPTAVSWAPGRLDYFVIGGDNAAYHKYWDGSGDWQPVSKYHERLEGKFTSGLAAASWGKGRIDLIGKGPDDEYYHLYLDGDSWQPDVNDWEDFGGNFSSKPAAVSWGPGRLDVIGITADGTLAHKYWNGDSWQPDVNKWEDFGGRSFVGEPVITSMGPNRFDMWVASSDGLLFHKYWNGQFYSSWEVLGGNFSTAPQVVHHTPGRIDIVGQFNGDTQYQYKLFDGNQWLPEVAGWYPKGGDFATQPALVSTRPNEMNIFGIGNDGQLYLQFWTGWDWQPDGTGYYPLGDTKNPYRSSHTTGEKYHDQQPIGIQEVLEDFCVGKENGNYRNPDNCRTFITCSNDYFYLFDCPADLVYNERTDQCDYRQNVPECEGKLLQCLGRTSGKE